MESEHEPNDESIVHTPMHWSSFLKAPGYIKFREQYSYAQFVNSRKTSNHQSFSFDEYARYCVLAWLEGQSLRHDLSFCLIMDKKQISAVRKLALVSKGRTFSIDLYGEKKGRKFLLTKDG